MNRHHPKEVTQVANNHSEKCLTSYGTRGIQVKTKMRYHYTPIRRTKIHSTENLKRERQVEKQNSHLFQVGMQNNTATLEDSSAIIYKAKHSLTIWSDNHASRCFSHGVEKITFTPKPAHEYL